MPLNIVILGGGFGGIYTLWSVRKSLKNIPHRITIVSKSEYFSFTPFLSEVAANILPPEEAMTYIKDIVKGKNEIFIKDLAKKVDLESKKVTLGDGTVLPFDYLVVAIGSTTNFMHIEGAEKYSLVLKNIDDAESIKEKIDTLLNEASKIESAEERRKMLSIAIIGGGATGIEIAGDLESHIAYLLEEKYQNIQKSETCLMIVNGGSEIAKEFDPDLREKAAELIKKENISLKLNSRVKEIQEGKILLTDNNVIEAHTIIWAAGVKANTMEVNPTSVIDHDTQKFIVDQFLRIKDYPCTFAIGDIALPEDPAQKLPMLAQAAVSEGIYTGKLIAQILKGKAITRYEFHSKGQLVSIGKGAGIAYVFGIKLSGNLAWFLWRATYLMKFIENRKKPLILFHWMLEILH